MKISEATKLSPAQMLSLAMALESKYAQRYLVWSRRFLPFNMGISTILDELYKEECVHQEDLQSFYRKRFGNRRPDEFSDAHIESLIRVGADPADHFFVVDIAMAKQILMLALEAEKGSCSFYHEVAEQTDSLDLKNILLPLAEFEDCHVQILQEKLNDLGVSNAGILAVET